MADEPEAAQTNQFERPPKFVWVLAMLAAILFVAAGTTFEYQNLRSVPVYETGGGMHEFVRVVEQEQMDVKNQLRYQSSADRELDTLLSLEPRFKALERYSILAARDFLRLKRKGGVQGLDQRTYNETEGALATYCDANPGEPQCLPEPDCKSYQAWAQAVELSQLTGATAYPTGPTEIQTATATPNQPSIRAMLGCSQRSVQILNEATRSQNRTDEVQSTKIMRQLTVTYPDLGSTTWPKVRSFVESYRVWFPTPDLASTKPTTKSEWSRFKAALGAIWSLPWLALIWIPLFIQYLILAAICGAISNVVRSCINDGETRNKYQLALQGGAAAWFGIMLIMIGFTITGVTGALISKVPEPSAVMVISFIAGLNAEHVNSLLGKIASGILQVPEKPGP